MITTLLRRRELKSFVRRLVRLLRLFAPTRPHVVVAGFPDTEGNAVEVVRGLLARGEPVHWLTDALTPAQAAEVLGAPSRHLSVLPKRSTAASPTSTCPSAGSEKGTDLFSATENESVPFAWLLRARSPRVRRA